MLRLLILTVLALTFVSGDEVVLSKSNSNDINSQNSETEVDNLIGIVEGKSGGGYGYGNGHDGYGNNGYGNSHHHNGHGHSTSYGYGHSKGYGHGHGNNYGHGHGNSYGHGHGHHKQAHVPIKIPYIDRNGCRFPGDKVCDPTSATTQVCSYFLCLLSDENKNLWKKPSMTVLTQTCGTDFGVLTEFCNTNERILRTIGYIKDDSDYHKYNHQPKLIKDVTPCIVSRATPC